MKRLDSLRSRLPRENSGQVCIDFKHDISKQVPVLCVCESRGIDVSGSFTSAPNEGVSTKRQAKVAEHVQIEEGRLVHMSVEEPDRIE